MKKLYSFYWDCGRMGSLKGLFIEEESLVQEAIGKEIYFGEVLGKHSEVYGELEEKDLIVKSEDQDFLNKLEELLGTTLSGYNPIAYYEDRKVDGYYDEEE